MEKLNLAGRWQLICEDGRRFPAAVPGTVLSALLENGVIPDPFDGMNEAEACRETMKTWRLERSFPVSAAMLAHPFLDLVFEGLDTLADVSLNGEIVLRADNMHRTWRIPAREVLREGDNILSVTFRPAMQAVRKAAEENPEVTDAGGSELLWTGSLRKAHYMFGWDWGPRLPDAGIWRPVRLEGYESRLEEIRIRQEHRENEVVLTVESRCGAERIAARLSGPAGEPVDEAEGPAGEPLRLTVRGPRLWWPNGLGDQPLYSLRIRGLAGGETADEALLRVGLRTLTVSRGKDAWGERFSLCCNGVDFFAMGADYIPEDNLLTRMNREKTAGLLRDCRDCHFNTIRVWGGGIYPGDDFFDLCDELGLVVWQDLMFACNTYKLTDSFRESIIREAEDNVRRFRHHASLGLLCGNNEMETAWLGWGGVMNQPESLKRDYLIQFEEILSGICRREAPDTFYWPSSPSSGGNFDDPNDLNRGDVHDWSVWHGRRPFTDFAERCPRFCSEFGFESFPRMDTLETFVHEEREMNPFSRVMESHQKCRNGNATILYYLSQTLRYPFSMEKLVHASQWLQAEAVKAGVEHWRRNRGRCMGAIYWQINDCWPVASWAGIDSLGRWKALQYAARRFFAPVAVSLRKEESACAAYVVSESRRPFDGTVTCILRDASGSRLREETFEAACPALGAVRAGDIPCGEEPFIVQAVLRDGEGRIVSENEMIAPLPKFFPFEKPRISVSCDGRRIRLTADAFCMGVEVQAGEARFSDNWLCLYPGEPREIRADRDLKPEEIRILWIE